MHFAAERQTKFQEFTPSWSCPKMWILEHARRGQLIGIAVKMVNCARIDPSIEFHVNHYYIQVMFDLFYQYDPYWTIRFVLQVAEIVASARF